LKRIFNIIYTENNEIVPIGSSCSLFMLLSCVLCYWMRYSICCTTGNILPLVP